MANIYQRGKTWWGSYTVNGRRKQQSLKTTSERKACEWAREIEALSTVRLLSEPSSTPLVPFLARYCQHLLANQSSVGAYNDLSRLRCFFGPCCEPLHYRPRGRHDPAAPNGTLKVRAAKLEDITPLMIGNRLNDDVAAGIYSRKTANDYREILQRMFNHAIALHSYVCPDARYKHPAEAVKRFKEAAPVISYLKPDEIDAQLAAVSRQPAIQAAVAVMIYAGLRRAEVFWLTCEDVDLGRRMLQVKAKNVGGRYWQPKTGRSRGVPIGQGLASLLTQYLDGRARPTCPWFIPAPAGGWWDPDNFSKDLQGVNAAAGLAWSALDFRHTFGSQLAQRGVSLYKISAMMGNSPEICRRHYAALCPEAMHADVEFSEAKTCGAAKNPRPADPAEPPGLRLVI